MTHAGVSSDTGATPTILVVEDDRIARVVTERVLRTAGYDVETLADGAEALARMRGPTVDVVVCDVVMPRVDGLAVCTAMKADDAWRFVPFILLTALTEDQDVVRCLEAGADELITKPVIPIVLTARVRAAQRTRGRYDELLRRPRDWSTLLRERRDQLTADAGLSAREREVLDLTLLGRTHEDVGLVLGITPRTSKFHLANVLQKLGADSRMDLFRLFL